MTFPEEAGFALDFLRTLGCYFGSGQPSEFINARFSFSDPA